MNISIIERIKQSADIVCVLDHYGIELRRAGRDFKAVCPFHEDHRPSLMVSRAKNICKCFACGDKAMDPAAFIMRMERCGYASALNRLARITGIDTCVYSGSDGRLQSVTPPPRVVPRSVSYITEAEVTATLTAYDRNPLYRFVASLFGSDNASAAFALYRVGTSSYWGGSAVFWQTDSEGRTRTGKVMGYDPSTGHRRQGQGRPQMAWMHTRRTAFRLQQCLFGEHLLQGNGEEVNCEAVVSQRRKQSVNIVESEKTALIAHLYQGGLWLATGGKKNDAVLLRAAHLLRHRSVTLWPDADATADWTALRDRLHREGWWDVRVNPSAASLAPGTKNDIADIIVSHIQGS